MFNISNKSFLFFMFFLGFSFLSLPSFADLITEPTDYFACHIAKLDNSNFKLFRSLFWNIGSFGLLSLAIASLLNKINSNQTNQMNKILIENFIESEKISKLTEGNFDISLGALIEAHGFAAKER